MSKCKCKCCCDCGPTYIEVIDGLHVLRIRRRLENALIVTDEEYRVYQSGLKPSLTYRDALLYEAGIDNLMYKGVPVVSYSERNNWIRKNRP